MTGAGLPLLMGVCGAAVPPPPLAPPSVGFEAEEEPAIGVAAREVLFVFDAVVEEEEERSRFRKAEAMVASGLERALVVVFVAEEVEADGAVAVEEVELDGSGASVDADVDAYGLSEVVSAAFDDGILDAPPGSASLSLSLSAGSELELEEAALGGILAVSPVKVYNGAACLTA